MTSPSRRGSLLGAEEAHKLAHGPTSPTPNKGSSDTLCETLPTQTSAPFPLNSDNLNAKDAMHQLTQPQTSQLKLLTANCSLLTSPPSPDEFSLTCSLFKGIKKVTSPDSLKYLDGRAASMLALLKKQDIESLATSSAKRRFFRIELETSGIDPDRVTTAHVEAAKAAGCTSLATWLDSLRKLCEYAGSEARRKWNPAATASDRASQVPIASDWFLQSTYLPEWDEMDFLSRCESIWTGNGFTGEGMMFTRIFNYRVKMLTGYEDEHDDPPKPPSGKA